ncbi:glycoside hydrolase family 25 protein [Ferruginibacter sp. SUN106]|uniref:glycoside hydrolase family 25 protein n=1 Tax=Ferruginibacter sp. SUN106 TaxID=2978348 RepID=UPI003D36A8C4
MAKKKTTVVKIIIVSVIYLSAASIAVFLITNYVNQPKFVRYPAFGIPIPVNYAIHGIDVSRHQAAIDWDDVSAMQDKNIRIGFTFIKATEGISNVDAAFRRNWLKAKEAKIPRGAYHFFISSKSGKAQAENFIQIVTLEKGDMPPVLDIEQANGASAEDIQQRAKDWLVMVEKRYKIKPVIYTNVDFYNNFLAGKFDDYPLWVAHYLVQDKPRIKRNWLFWQHNESGRVNGIDAYVDFNVFNGDSTDFKNLLMK